MIPRTTYRQASRLAGSPVASSSRLPIRNLSSAMSRPSRIALSKRPLLTPSASLTPIRHLSWTPWKRELPVPEPSPLSEAASVTPAQSTALPAEVEVAPSTSASSIPADPSSPLDTPSVPLDTSVPDASSTADVATEVPLHTLENGTIADLVHLNPDIPLEQLLRTPEAIATTLTRSDLPSIGLDHAWYSIPGWAVDGLVSLNSITGLPWWATIACLTLAVRLSLLRMVISNQKHNVRLQNAMPQIKALSTRITSQSAKEDPAEQQLAQTALKNLMAQENVNPLKPARMAFTQLPVFLGLFYGLQRMAAAPIPGFLQGGLGWVHDLTMTDPYLILPITSVLFTNIVIRVGADGTGSNGTQQSELGRHMKNIVAVLSIPGLWFVSSMPAGVLFYWTTTNAFTLIQAYLLSRPGIKAWLGIGKPNHVPSAPGVKTSDASLKETFHYAVDFFRNGYILARERQGLEFEKHNREALARGRKIGSESIRKEVIRVKRKN